LGWITPRNNYFSKDDFDLDKSIASNLEEEGTDRDRYTSIFASPVHVSIKVPEVLKITSTLDASKTKHNQLSPQSLISSLKSGDTYGLNPSEYAYTHPSENLNICTHQMLGGICLKSCQQRAEFEPGRREFVELEENLSGIKSPIKSTTSISKMKKSTGKAIEKVLKTSPGKALSKLLKKSPRNTLLDQENSTKSSCTDSSSLSTCSKIGWPIIPKNYTFTSESDIVDFDPCSYHKYDGSTPTQNQCNVVSKGFQLDNTLDDIDSACEEAVFQRIAGKSGPFAQLIGKIIPKNKTSKKEVTFKLPSLMTSSTESSENGDCLSRSSEK
jgi:hypothetical protein